jgi:hypothetical protein
MDAHTVEPLEPEPSLVDVKIANGILKTYKHTGIHEIPEEVIKVRLKYILRYTN